MLALPDHMNLAGGHPVEGSLRLWVRAKFCGTFRLLVSLGSEHYFKAIVCPMQMATIPALSSLEFGKISVWWICSKKPDILLKVGLIISSSWSDHPIGLIILSWFGHLPRTWSLLFWGQVNCTGNYPVIKFVLCTFKNQMFNDYLHEMVVRHRLTSSERQLLRHDACTFSIFGPIPCIGASSLQWIPQMFVCNRCIILFNLGLLIELLSPAPGPIIVTMQLVLIRTK